MAASMSASLGVGVLASKAAAALLDKTPKPTDAEIDAAMTNLCRCGTYQRVRAAIHRAARNMKGTA